MAMPKNITLINKQTKAEKVLTLPHALSLLILESSQGRNTYDLQKGYIFNGTDIVRVKKKKNEPKDE